MNNPLHYRDVLSPPLHAPATRSPVPINPKEHFPTLYITHSAAIPVDLLGDSRLNREIYASDAPRPVSALKIQSA